MAYPVIDMLLDAHPDKVPAMRISVDGETNEQKGIVVIATGSIAAKLDEMIKSQASANHVISGPILDAINHKHDDKAN
jgi:hypothetical protein